MKFKWWGSKKSEEQKEKEDYAKLYCEALVQRTTLWNEKLSAEIERDSLKINNIELQDEIASLKKEIVRLNYLLTPSKTNSKRMSKVL